jgi:hypothetical protein
MCYFLRESCVLLYMTIQTRGLNISRYFGAYRTLLPLKYSVELRFHRNMFLYLMLSSIVNVMWEAEGLCRFLCQCQPVEQFDISKDGGCFACCPEGMFMCFV